MQSCRCRWNLNKQLDTSECTRHDPLTRRIEALEIAADSVCEEYKTLFVSVVGQKRNSMDPFMCSVRELIEVYGRP